MTLVTITLTVPDGQVGDPESPAVGYQQWTPVGPGARRRAEGPAREVLPASFRVDLLPGVTTVEVAPTSASWVWLVREHVDGAGTSPRAIAVPDQSTIDYRDCPQVDLRTLGPMAAPPDPIWVQQLAALTDEIAAAQGHEEAAELAASDAAAAQAAAEAVLPAMIVDGEVVGDDLILTTHAGAPINAGDVRGTTGPRGLPGPVQLSPDPLEPELYDIGTYDAISPTWYVTPEQYGAVGDGMADDAAAIQTAVDAAAAIRGVARFTADTYAVGSPIVVPSHVTLDLGTSWIQQLASIDPAADTKVLNLYEVEDVRIVGGTIAGDRLTRTIVGADGDGSTCINIYACKDVLITGTTARDSSGDGIMVSDLARNPSAGSVEAGSTVIQYGSNVRNDMLLAKMAEAGGPRLLVFGVAFPAGTEVASVDPAARTVTVSNPATAGVTNQYITFYRAEGQNVILDGCTGDNNRRNGLTVAEGRGYVVRNCRFVNTHGTSPEAGIDVEPYYGLDFLRDVIIEGCVTEGNVGGGLFFQNLRDGVVRGCFLAEGLMLRGAFDCFVTDNKIPYVTLKDATALISGNDIGGRLNIYSYGPVPASSGAGALDVKVIGNSIRGPVTLFNPDGGAPVYRNVVLAGNSVEITAATINYAIVGTSDSAAAQSFTVADNDMTVHCSGLMSTNIALMFNLQADARYTIKGNRLRYYAGSAYILTKFARIAGTALVEGNEVEWVCPNLSGIFHFITAGTARVIRNSLNGSVPVVIQAAGGTVHAVGNVSMGPTALAAPGTLTTDSTNVSI